MYDDAVQTFGLAAFFLLAQTWQVPELQLQRLNGPIERLSDYRDRIVVLNFWATWCVPCKEEMPLFVEMQSKYGARGVQFIGVSTEDETTRSDVPGFVRKNRIEFPIWLNGTSEIQFSFHLATMLPATVILDRNLQPVFRIIGQSNRKDLSERLDWLVSNRSAAPPAELVLPAGVTAEHFGLHELGLADDDEETEKAASGSEVPA